MELKLPKNLSKDLKSILKPMSEAPHDGSWIFVMTTGHEDSTINHRIEVAQYFIPTQEQMKNKVLPCWERLCPDSGFFTLPLDEVLGWFNIWESKK